MSVVEDYVKNGYDYKKTHDEYANDLPNKQNDLYTLHSMLRNGDLPVKKVVVEEVVGGEKVETVVITEQIPPAALPPALSFDEQVAKIKAVQEEFKKRQELEVGKVATESKSLFEVPPVK